MVDQAITKPKSNYVFHEVVKGNTLYSISKMYDVEQKKLIELNPGCDKILSIGTLIKIKEIDNTVEIVDNSQSVIVDNNVKIDKPKDEKTQIDITPNRVDTVNNRNIELIEHTVRKGETLFSLSRKYNVTKEDILNHNKGCSQTLTIGDKLKIPVVKDSNPVIVEENVIEEVKDD